MQKNTSTTIAIIHGLIELGKFEQNIRKIEEVAERAKAEEVEILLLPAMINGVPIFDLRKNLRIKRVTETIPGRTSEYLARIASKYNLYIIVGPILERRGSKVYRSTFVIEPTMDIRFVISQIFVPSVYGQSFSPPIVTVKNVSIGVFIAEDIHLPELSLLMKILGVNLAIFYPYPYISVDKILAILKARALELKSMVISIGCTAKRKDEEVAFMPTAIVDEYGAVIHEVLDRSFKMVKVAIPIDHKHNIPVLNTAHRKLLKLLSKTLAYYVKRSGI